MRKIILVWLCILTGALLTVLIMGLKSQRADIRQDVELWDLRNTDSYLRSEVNQNSRSIDFIFGRGKPNRRDSFVLLDTIFLETQGAECMPSPGDPTVEELLECGKEAEDER